MLEVSEAAAKYEWLQSLGEEWTFWHGQIQPDFCAFLGVRPIISALFLCTGWSNLPQPSLCHAALHTLCISGLHAPRGNSSQCHCLLLWTAQGYWYGEEKKNQPFFPEFSPLGLIFPFPNAGSSWRVRKVNVPGLCQVERRCVCINKGSHCL